MPSPLLHTYTQRLFLGALCSTLLLSACGSYNALGGSSSTQQRPTGWSTLSHSKSAAPDYDMVFADNTVKRMDIEITPEHWQEMQDDMTTLFGSGNGGFGGGGQPPGGFAPGEAPEGFERPEVTFDEAGNPVFPEGFTPPERPAGAEGGMGGPPGGGGGGLGDDGENPMWQEATIRFEDQEWQYVGIRYKGNSSLRSSWGRTEKMPFRLNFDHFEDAHPEIDDQRFYGFKKLTFSSGFSDDSLIREKVVADIFREAGVPAPRTAFYRVYVNYGEGEKYWGLYTLVEPPADPMLETQFGSDKGNLYKPSGSGARFVTFDQDAFDKENHEEAADWSDIQAVFTALHADRSDAARWRQGLEQVFDVPHYLRYLAVNTLIQNWDTYGRMEHNYYLYTDPANQKVRWIPWDNNMALGGGMGGGMRPGNTTTANPNTETATVSMPSDTTEDTGTTTTTAPAFNGRNGGGGPGGNALSLALTAEEVGDNWPLIRYLIDDPVYQQVYREEVEKAMNGAFAIGPTRQRYQQAHDLIRPYVIGENGETSEATLLSSPEAFDPALETLFEHLESRHTAAAAFLNSQ